MPFDNSPKEVVVENETAGILRGAADYIRVHGWCQNALTDKAGRVCMRGALMAAAFPETFAQAALGNVTGLVWEEPALYRASRVLDRSLKHEAPHYNDKIAKSAAEVIGALERAALLAEE